MQAGTYFPKVRRMLLFHAPLISTHFWAASTLLREPNALVILSLPETDPQNFGAFGLRWWGSPGQIYPSEGFWSRILVWRAIAFVNFTRWIGFGMSVPFRRIDFGGVMSWNTQPNCRASEDWRLDEFCHNLLSLLFPGFPGRSWHSSVTGSLSCQFPFFNIATALVSSFFLDLSVGCSSTWRCANEHFSPNRQPLLVL